MIKKLKQLSGEFVFTLILFAVGIIWVVNGINLGLWAGITPAPGLFPLIVGVMLSLLTFVRMLSLLKRNENKKRLSQEEKKIILSIAISAALCAVMMNLLGTFFTLAIGLMLWFRLIARYSWYRSLIYMLSILIVIYLVFVVWLSVPFPKFFGLF